MSIRINNKIIAGNSGEAKSTSYRYVGEIFQSAIPIDDIKVACLDGHKIYSDEGYGSFIQHLISQSVLYPQLVCTEEVWQEKVVQYGSWGQFVINTQENSVRLPKIAGFVQGLNTLEDLASLLEAGLPNIKGEWTPYVGGTNTGQGWDVNNVSISGAFGRTTTTSAKTSTNTTGTYSSAGLTFNASLSNPIYGKSDTVQPQAIQYPYYIVLATGVVQEINIKDEVHLNNPFFFGMSEYYENEPSNISWLKSEGQWNSKDVYISYYEWLEEQYNESNTNVKLHTEEYDDYNFVINQEEGTFRLPLLDGSEDLPSGKYILLTLGASGDRYTAQANGFVYASIASTNLSGISFVSLYNETKQCGEKSDIYRPNTSTSVTQRCIIEVSKGDFFTVSYNMGTITGSTLKFYYAQGNGSLYFYVGETVQNANLINAGRVLEQLTKPHIVKTYQNGTSWYRIWSDGWCEQGGRTTKTVNQNVAQTITLLKSFKDTNYTISAIPNYEGGGDTTFHINVYPKSSSSFYIYCHWTSTGQGLIWEAKGYIN